MITTEHSTQVLAQGNMHARCTPYNIYTILAGQLTRPTTNTNIAVRAMIVGGLKPKQSALTPKVVLYARFSLPSAPSESGSTLSALNVNLSCAANPRHERPVAPAPEKLPPISPPLADLLPYLKSLVEIFANWGRDLRLHLTAAYYHFSGFAS